MDDLEELLLFDAIRDMRGEAVEWPPRECCFQCYPDSECECECKGKPEQPWHPGRGACGWDDDEYGFYATYVKPQEVLKRRAESKFPYSRTGEPWRVYLTNRFGDNPLLVKDASSCREATPADVEEFSSSTAEDDVSKFDIYLSLGADSADIYVFLAPYEQRLTGQVKPGTKLTPS
jgi:hypothetical protein